MATETSWTAICAVDRIVPNTGVCAKVGKAQVAVFRLTLGLGEEQFYAISNLDPFSGASVLSRGLVGDIGGQIVVASPVYKHHYALKTGACLEDDSVNLPVYPVRVENGQVLVAAGGHA